MWTATSKTYELLIGIQIFQSLQFIIYSIFSQRIKLSISWVYDRNNNRNEHLALRDLNVKGNGLLASYKVDRILESGKPFHMDSGILGFGIQNTAQGRRSIWSLANDWNLEFKFYWQKSRIWNEECTAWNTESKIDCPPIPPLTPNILPQVRRKC